MSIWWCYIWLLWVLPYLLSITLISLYHADHFGVVKAFLDADLLPRVISGTSAGGLVAALVCTRTDAELRELLIPELADRISACEEPFKVWFTRFWHTGARFDSVAWAKKVCYLYWSHCSVKLMHPAGNVLYTRIYDFPRGIYSDWAYTERFCHSGRATFVSACWIGRLAVIKLSFIFRPTKLLNYLTAPDTVIWSALLASAAVPGILNPVVLMQKLRDGSVVPWNWGSKFKDGSLRSVFPSTLYKRPTNPSTELISLFNP